MKTQKNRARSLRTRLVAVSAAISMKDSLSEEELREQLSLFYSAPVANDRPDFR